MIIYKYELNLNELQTLDISLVKALDVKYNEAEKKFFLWAIVDKTKEPRPINFICLGTGQEFDGDIGEHISTVTVGNFIFHWFMKEVV